jgi:outer membrane beta-barrel protein
VERVTMNRALLARVAEVGLAASLLIAWWSNDVAAQQGADMSFDINDTAEGGDQQQGGADMDFTQGDQQQGDQQQQGSGDVIGDLAGGQQEGGQQAATDRPDRNEAREEIFAVQQIYALRINRVEVSPSVAFSVNDPFVSHVGVGIGLNYWWTNVLAIGANFLWYEGLESESNLNFFVRRSTRLAVPISQYQFGANLNFTYVPLYGKFAMFNEFIFQWDAYVVGGVGIMRTRPVPVVDPTVRRFEFDFRIAFNVGIGLRVFLSRWLAVFGEIRDYMYLEQLEALQVAIGADRFNSSTWAQGSPAFTNNVTIQLGLTVFFPFDFDYRLPR